MKKGRGTFYNFVFLRHSIWFKDMMQTGLGRLKKLCKKNINVNMSQD